MQAFERSATQAQRETPDMKRRLTANPGTSCRGSGPKQIHKPESRQCASRGECDVPARARREQRCLDSHRATDLNRGGAWYPPINARDYSRARSVHWAPRPHADAGQSTHRYNASACFGAVWMWRQGGARWRGGVARWGRPCGTSGELDKIAAHPVARHTQGFDESSIIS